MLSIILTDVKGKKTKFNHPVKFNLIRSEDAPADGLYLLLSIEGRTNEIVKAEVFLDGDKIFYGWVDEQTEKTNKNGSVLEIKARSPEALLLDNEAMPQTYCLPSFGIIFERHFRPLGFTGYHAPEKNYNGELVISKGMSQWDVLKDFCDKFTGTKPFVRYDGVIDIMGGIMCRDVLIGKTKIISLSHKFKRSALISDIIARTYHAGSYKMSFKGKKAHSLDVRRQRYVNVVGSRLRSIADVKKMISDAESVYESVEILYDSWLNCDKGDILSVEGEKQKYIIREIQMSADASGEKTRLLAEVTENVDQQEYGIKNT